MATTPPPPIIGGGTAALLFALAMAMTVGDLLENRELLALSGASEPADMADALRRLRIATLIKWYAIYAASAVAAGFIWREPSWWRWSAPCFGGAALLGFSSVIHLPGIEYGTLLLVVAWLMTYARAFHS